MGCYASFDYGEMAREAARERDRLKARVQARREEGPRGREFRGWERECRMLYEMYLEQRGLCRELERRAAWRGAGTWGGRG